MRPRHLLIFFVLPIRWWLSPKREAEALLEFSQTELDSAWQGLYALERVQDPKLQAALFYHALEEYYHADLFRDLFGTRKLGHLDLPVKPREAVLAEAGRNRLLRFLAYVHVGEREVNLDFNVYAAARIDGSVSALFRKISADEAGHVGDSLEMLESVPGATPGDIREAVFRANIDYAYRRFQSLMSGIGQWPMRAMLSATYFILGAVAYRAAVERLKLTRSQQTDIAREQIFLFESQFRL